MKKAVILFISIFISAALIAQSNQVDIVEKGNVLTLGNSSRSGYQNIDFPRANTIVKKGAIPNFKSLEGCKVIVTEVQSNNEVTKIVLKRKDGLNFFRFIPTVTANFEKAIVQGELIAPSYKGLNSLAQQ